MTDLQVTMAATAVDEWYRGGVRHAVICPGSRSTPLALALYRHGGIECHVRIDERSAGFFAIGCALACGAPTVICVTSGTAAAELHPAVVEADLAQVPLIVVTADRPPELQGVGAPQTIDQVDLFGRAVRAFVAPGVATESGRDGWRQWAAQCVLDATDHPHGPGPVHCNLAFREPLLGTIGALPAPGDPPLPVVSAPFSIDPGWAASKGLLICGARSGEADDALALAHHLGWPVLVDATAPTRRAHPNVMAAVDLYLRDDTVRSALRPEVVIAVGGRPAAKSVSRLLSDVGAAGGTVVAVERGDRLIDPEGVVSEQVVADPATFFAHARKELVAPAGSDWLALWQRIESMAQAYLDEHIGGPGYLTEPGLARACFDSLPPGGALMVASSMPIRDVETFARLRADPPLVVANRGANGIDGVTSTARGVAAAHAGPVVALIGDIALLHDLSGLVSGEHASGFALVMVDNDGGGIFSFLDQAGLDEPEFEVLFGTPVRTEWRQVATGLGWHYSEVTNTTELLAALSHQPRSFGLFIRARMPLRRANVEIHRELAMAVSQQARQLLAQR